VDSGRGEANAHASFREYQVRWDGRARVGAGEDQLPRAGWKSSSACSGATGPRFTRICVGGPAIYFKMLTARAMTRTRVTTEMIDCESIVSFAQRVMGIASVGLNAIAFVNDT
jgi:hypothetical protein